MAEQTEGFLSPDASEPLQPAAVAEELAATDANAADLPAALREDQIQNAVSFLSHPKVRGSTKESKTSFLERKGLTAAEIAEAFQRVPETSAAPAVSHSVTPTQQGTLPPRKPFHGDTVSALQPVTYAVQPAPPQPQSARWTQVVIGASVLVAGAYAVKQLVGPYAVSWYRRLYGIEQASEEDTRRAEEKKTADIVAAAIKSQTEELRATVDSLKEMVRHLDKGKGIAAAPAEPGIGVDDLRSELHAFATTLSDFAPRPAERAADVSAELRELKAMLKERVSSGSGAPSPAPKAPAAAYPPYSSGPITHGTQSVAPPASRFPHRQPEAPGVEAANAAAQGSSPATSSGQEKGKPPHPPSYMEVLEMLEKGETPSNIRTDINDKPPNPAQPPPSSLLQPRPKPWESAHSPAAATNGGPPPANGSIDAYQRSAALLSAGVTITELDDSPAPAPAGGGAWRPPPVPQPSLKLPAAAHSSSSSVAPEEEPADES